jgi:hypothetical protein
VLDRAIRELLPIVREVLLPVVEAQLDDDRSIGATSDELLTGSSLELEGSEDRIGP